MDKLTQTDQTAQGNAPETTGCDCDNRGSGQYHLPGCELHIGPSKYTEATQASYPTVPLFRTLSDPEIQSFRKWARDNYQPLTAINGLWHPIVQDECRIMNQQAGRAIRLSPFHAHDALRQSPAYKAGYRDAAHDADEAHDCPKCSQHFSDCVCQEDAQ